MADRILFTIQAVLGVLLLAAWWRYDASGSAPAAIVLAIAACLIAVAAWSSLGSAFKITPSPRANHTLIAHGIYRWLRHPMYTAVVLVLAAAVVSRPSQAVQLIGLLNFIFYLAKARYEEGLLAAHYPGYREYRHTSFGVIPLYRSRRPGPDH